MNKFFDNWIKMLFFGLVTIGLGFFTYCLKCMWIFGRFTMLEPNKTTAFIEFIMMLILTCIVSMITTNHFILFWREVKRGKK